MRVPSINLHLIAQRAAGRSTCVKAGSAIISSGARIYNLSGGSERIRIGNRSIVQGELMTLAHGGQIKVGDWCYIGKGSRLWSGASIDIGDRVLIAHGVDIFDTLTHPLDAAGRHRQFQAIYLKGHPTDLDLDDRPVRIGDDAWIGAGAFVLRGIQIGAGAIVAARSVVSRNVEPYTVVAGNPAKEIRRLLRP
jgi:acetyltransferase-like isoleucine patch superfamily enzyme